jgi:hypothetical protein
MKHRNFLFVAISSLLIITLSCEKIKFDDRNDYLGDWTFTTKITEFNTDSIGYLFQDTITYQGTIKYGNDKNELSIDYHNGTPLIVTLGENGKLENLPTHYCSGSFSNTSTLNIYLKWGGLGGGVTHQVYATR